MFSKLIEFARKANKWYIWVLVALLIAGVIALQALGFVGCQSVKVCSDSSSVSVSGDFDLQPQTSAEVRLNKSYNQPVE